MIWGVHLERVVQESGVVLNAVSLACPRIVGFRHNSGDVRELQRALWSVADLCRHCAQQE